MTTGNSAITKEPVEIPATWEVPMPLELLKDLKDCRRRRGFMEYMKQNSGVAADTIRTYIKNKEGMKGKIEKISAATEAYKALIGKENAA